MSLTDPNYRQHVANMQRWEAEEKAKAKAAQPEKVQAPTNNHRVTPEQATLIDKIRKSAWKDYLQEPRWCAWFQGKPKPDGDGFAKVPMGSHSDPQTWCTFDELCAKLTPGQGIGYNFLEGDLHPLDIDHVRNPKTGMICPEAMLLLSRLQSFSEVSISGRGLHVVFKGQVRGHQLGETCVQYWNPAKAPRFFTVTGDVVGEAFSTIRDIGEDFNVVFAIAAHISAKCREELATVDPEQFAKLPAEPVKKAEKKREKSSDKKRQRHPDFNMEEFLAWAGLPVDNVTENNIGKLYRIASCPIKGEPHVGQNGTSTNFGLTADGGLMFHCQSTGCVEYHFADVLKMLEEKLGKYPNPIYGEKKQIALVKQLITIQWADTIKRESTQWLIPQFLPLCECTAFSGEMDTRKSTTALDIAAKGSVGNLWQQQTPNGKQIITAPFSTIYAGTEDSFSVVQNRFVAAGGNLKALGKLPLEVVYQKESPDGVEEWSTSLSFAEHLNALRDAIVKANKEAPNPVGLLINDPLIAFFGDKNFNKAQDCQVILKGLKQLCEELKISIINLMHFNKTQGASAKEKTGGSQRLIEAHRMAWSFTLIDDTDKNSNTLISPIKKNLLKVAKSYEIRTVSTPVEWEEDGVKKRDEVGVFEFVRFSDQTTEGQLLEKASKDRSKDAAVRDAILETLKKDAVAPGIVYNTLRDLGSESTVLRAVNKLIKNGKVRKDGTGPSNTRWMLATSPHQDAMFDKPA